METVMRRAHSHKDISQPLGLTEHKMRTEHISSMRKASTPERNEQELKRQENTFTLPYRDGKSCAKQRKWNGTGDE